MGLWDSIKKSAFGGVIDLATGWLGNEFIEKPNANSAYGMSKEGAETAWNRTYGAYKTRYQDTTADMRKAGLNPILAASSGFNVGSGPTAVAASGYQPKAYNLSSTNSGLALAKSDESEKAGKKNIEEAKKARAEAYKKLEEIFLVRMQKRVAGQQEVKLMSEVSVNYKRLRQIEAEVAKTQANTRQSIQQTKLLAKQTKKLRLSLIELKKVADFYKTPLAGTMLKAIETAIKTITPFKFKIGE